jgi:hypothetical protein
VIPTGHFKLWYTENNNLKLDNWFCVVYLPPSCYGLAAFVNSGKPGESSIKNERKAVCRKLAQINQPG